MYSRAHGPHVLNSNSSGFQPHCDREHRSLLFFDSLDASSPRRLEGIALQTRPTQPYMFALDLLRSGLCARHFAKKGHMMARDGSEVA